MSEMVTLWLVVLIVSIGGGRHSGTDEHLVRRRRRCGSDCRRIAGTDLVADPAIFCSVSAAVIFHQTCRSQIFQQRPRKDKCGKYDRQTGDCDQ